ncbi:MAG: hypothetical protein AB7S26_30050 [Sandaracinaceae bacterium]
MTALRSFAVFALLLTGGCDGADAPTPVEPPPPPTTDDVEEPLTLGVPPEMIHEARREAAGLYRLPRSLRAHTLEERRAAAAPAYAELLADADAHARERVTFTGEVSLVRSAGPRLWIMVMKTREADARWVDPIYVLATIPPSVPPDGGIVATIDGWVVGEREIGQHTLPLIVAYYIEVPES